MESPGFSTEDVVAREMSRITYEKVLKISSVQDEHTGMLAVMDGRLDRVEADVSTLKSDMSEVKSTLATILDRLPDKT